MQVPLSQVVDDREVRGRTNDPVAATALIKLVAGECEQVGVQLRDTREIVRVGKGLVNVAGDVGDADDRLILRVATNRAGPVMLLRTAAAKGESVGEAIGRVARVVPIRDSKHRAPRLGVNRGLGDRLPIGAGADLQAHIFRIPGAERRQLRVQFHDPPGQGVVGKQQRTKRAVRVRVDLRATDAPVREPESAQSGRAGAHGLLAGRFRLGLPAGGGRAGRGEIVHECESTVAAVAGEFLFHLPKLASARRGYAERQSNVAAGRRAAELQFGLGSFERDRAGAGVRE